MLATVFTRLAALSSSMSWIKEDTADSVPLGDVLGSGSSSNGLSQLAASFDFSPPVARPASATTIGPLPSGLALVVRLPPSGSNAGICRWSDWSSFLTNPGFSLPLRSSFLGLSESLSDVLLADLALPSGGLL